MKAHAWRELAAAALPGAAFAVLLACAAGLLAATMTAAERAALWALAEPRVALLVMLWFFTALVGGVAGHWAWLRFAAAPGRLAEEVQVATGSDRALSIAPAGSAGSRALAAAVNTLAAQRDALRAEIAQRVAEGSRAVEQERSRLAALMAELTQSVVVCNLDGRILLFNARARLQFRALLPGAAGGGTGGAADSAADSAAIGGGTEAIALGRSIYAVLDRQLVAHALEAVQQRLARGVGQPSAQFVTATRGGQLLRVQMAAVRAIAADPSMRGTALNGFVLMFDNITREMAEDTEREQLLHALTEGSRGAVGNLQAAVELLDDPQLDAATRERFLGVVRDESRALARRLNEAAQRSNAALKTRWPLEDMLGADFAAAAAQRLQAELGGRVVPTDVDPLLWLRVESFSLLQALLHLARHLKEDFGVKHLQLRLAAEGERARLDLVWAGQAMSTETVAAWETEPMQAGSTALTLRDVVARHGGAFWFERERARQQAFFRFLLPRAGAAAPLEDALPMPVDGRPEFYDFDLFAAHNEGGVLADKRLSDLTFTVFDTETTGLNPSAGDEIIQFGAVRVVAGKLRRADRFEQLVNPQRALSPGSIAVHGITPEMLASQPALGTVLPAFHAFAADTVLVAHNAAFDMRFLQLKEASTGLRFEQPVLDTLLLSEVLHPNQASHRIEAIAARLGVDVLGRHTALGDAIVTAECFLKMLPLLQAEGITTLGQALDASRETYLARVSY